MADSYGAYRLTAPDRRAYDPTTLEQVYAQRVGRADQNSDAILGFMLEAQGDRQRSADRYDLQLAGMNDQQYKLGMGKLAQDQYATDMGVLKTALEHPDQAYAFSGSRRLFAPDAMEHGARMANAGLALTRGKALQAAGTGMNQLGEAGVVAPMGALFDPSTGTTNVPLVQGTPRDIAQEQIKGSYSLGAARARAGGEVAAAKLNHATGAANAYDDIGNARMSMISSEVRSAFSQAGATYDNEGRMLTPPKLTQGQQQEIVDNATRRADAYASQRHETMGQVYERAGHAYIRPDNPYRLNAPRNTGVNTAQPPVGSPGAQSEATVGTQGGPAMPVGGTGSNSRASTPAPRPTVNESLGHMDALRRGLAAAGVADPAGAARRAEAERAKYGANARVRVTRDGAVEIGDAQGKVVGRVELR